MQLPQGRARDGLPAMTRKKHFAMPDDNQPDEAKYDVGEFGLMNIDSKKVADESPEDPNPVQRQTTTRAGKRRKGIK
jgi:hypothetical protein